MGQKYIKLDWYFAYSNILNQWSAELIGILIINFTKEFKSLPSKELHIFLNSNDTYITINSMFIVTHFGNDEFFGFMIMKAQQDSMTLFE